MRRLELKIPPPLVLFATAGVMWGIVGMAPQTLVVVPGRLGCSIFCALLGAVIALTGVWTFRQRGTTISPIAPERASQLVASGIYRFTRNPMYLGMGLALLGWAVFLGNTVALLGLPLFVVLLNRLQIVPEERMLAKLFGEDFTSYCSRVRRWL